MYNVDLSPYIYIYIRIYDSVSTFTSVYIDIGYGMKYLDLQQLDAKVGYIDSMASEQQFLDSVRYR